MINRPKTLASTLLLIFRTRWRSLLTYHLFFVILAATILIPSGGWLLTELLDRSGHPVVSNEALLTFAFSPTGLFWLLLAGTLALTLAFIQVSGLLELLEVHGRHRYRAVSQALLATIPRIPSLLKLAIVQVAAHLLIAVPVLLLVFALAYWLLADFDPYYLISYWPREKVVFLLMTVPLLLLALASHLWLYVRWVLALPIMVFESASPLQALRRSRLLTESYRLPITLTIVGVALATLSAPILFNLSYPVVANWVLRLAGGHLHWLISLSGFLLALYLIISILIGMLVVMGNGLVIRHLYLQARGINATHAPPPAKPLQGALAWITELALLIFVAGQSIYWVSEFFEPQDSVAISAHRGSSFNAPENTLAAIELAIAEGADYIEVDVQMTRDGGLILAHDRDFRRMGGPNTPVWELSLEQARAIDVGAWFSPEFAGQRPPTLEETIQAVRSHAKLYLELKAGPDRNGLVRRVLEALEAEEFHDQTLLAALDRDLLAEAHRLAPQLRRSLFVHTAVGTPDYSDLDAVGFRAATVDNNRLRAARSDGHELHVWTVNDPADMHYFIDLGVDNIITDRPDVLSELLAERAELSEAELLLLRLMHRLR